MASETEFTASDAADLPGATWSAACLNSSRSSVMMIVSTDVPSTLTSYLSKIPAWSISTPQLSAVWPPIERMMPSGFSFWMMLSTCLGVTGMK